MYLETIPCGTTQLYNFRLWSTGRILYLHIFEYLDHNRRLAQCSVGEVQFSLVWGHFCWTRDWMVWSLTEFLGPGLGLRGTVYIGLILVQTQSRLGPAELCTIFMKRGGT